MTMRQSEKKQGKSDRELHLSRTGTKAGRASWTRLTFVCDGVFCLALAIGFAFQVPWVTALWRWLEGPIANGYFAAILASFGAGSLLLAWSREWQAATGGPAALIITCLGFAAHAAVRYALGEDDGLLIHATVLAVVAAFAVSTLLGSLNSDLSDMRPVPRGLRYFFLVFALLLLACGIALLFGAPGVMPWELAVQTSLLIGWIFVGLSAEYAYVALRGRLPDVRVLLVGFLVYGAVFAPALLQHFGVVESDYLPSLIANVGVLVLSAPLAIFYLTIAKAVRPITAVDHN